MRYGSFNGATADMVLRQTPDSPVGGGLRTRILAALALAPPVIAAIYFGPPYSDLLVLLAAIVMAWEWASLAGDRRPGWAGICLVAAVALAVAAGAFGEFDIAIWVIPAGAMAVAVAGAREPADRTLWRVFGVFYLATACLGFQWLRSHPAQGLEIVIWMIAVVWATDIAAYFTGRGLGGPKLAPSISPKKTWSGLAGGMLAAALVGVAFAFLAGDGPPAVFLALQSAILAVVAQLGDLLESGLKRQFGAKDSSRLIPGHGGVLDRADGVLAASIWVAFLIWSGGSVM